METTVQAVVEAAKERAERTCVGCRGTTAPRALVRLAVGPVAPFVAPDVSGRARGREGRSVWVHPRRACVLAAARGGIARSLRREVTISGAELVAAIARALEQRVESLLLSAVRRRGASVGTDATREALARGSVEALVLAGDAAGRREELSTAAERLGRRVLIFSTKAGLGRLFGREEVAVIGILESGIAQELVESGERLLGLSEAE